MKRRKRRLTGKRKREIIQIGLVLALFVILLAFAAKYPSIIGKAIGEDHLETHIQTINLETHTRGTHTIQLENTPEKFNLKSIKLSGKLAGEGHAQIYLENDKGKLWLILDTENLNQGNLLTGLVIAEENLNGTENETINTTTHITNETLNITINETTNETINITNNETINTTINPALNLTINETRINITTNETLNPTINMSETNVSEHIQNLTLL